ncbi:MAG: GTP-binding protein [Candidatus Micrarchaeia archaeon]
MGIASGITKLDEHLGGGFEQGKSIAIVSIPGIDARVFAYHIISTNPTMKTLYVVENIFPDQIERDVSRYLFSGKAFSNTMYFDAFSTGLGMPSRQKYYAKDATDMQNVAESIINAVSSEKPWLVIIDSLSGMLAKAKNKESVWSMIRKLTDNGTTVLCIYTKWDEKEAEDVKQRLDYVIETKSVEERLLSRRYFRVVKAPGKFNASAVPFRIGFDGIALYVPKIIITGPFHAGKTTFIHKISTRAVSVNRMGTTIALDHGYVEHSGFSVDLFGTPGQERFEFMLDILNKDAFGVVLIVDSTKPETFERAKQMLAHVSRYSLPYVVVANKQDLPSALPPAKVKEMLGLDAEVVGAVAIEGKGCIEALKILINNIVESGA